MKKFKDIFKGYENKEAKKIGEELSSLFEKSIKDLENDIHTETK